MFFLDIISNIFDDLMNLTESKGARGERLAHRSIGKVHEKQHILQNVYVKKQNGEYSEIDLISIDKKGIFVFESKNVGGWIYGKENEPYWTQCFFENKYQLYNPVWQNNSHIKSLKYLLKNYPQINYTSIIVFSDRCELKKITSTNPDTHIIKRHNLQKLLNNLNDTLRETITETQIEEIINILKETNTEKNIKEVHINSIKEHLKKCPLCHAELVVRNNSKTGESFYGCKNYPNCKFTRKIQSI